MATELEKALELISKETKQHEVRQKQLQTQIRNLEGEYQAAQSEHKIKMDKLRSDSEIEQKAIQLKNEPLRIQLAQLTQEVESMKGSLQTLKANHIEAKSAHNIFKSQSTKDLDSEIAIKRKELDGINYAIKEARRMIGVH